MSFWRQVHRPRTRRVTRGPVHDRKYREWIRTLPCCACGQTPRSQAAHTGAGSGMARKADDRTCVPLCAECHLAYDNGVRSKAAFEAEHRICMADLVAELNRQYDVLTTCQSSPALIPIELLEA